LNDGNFFNGLFVGVPRAQSGPIAFCCFVGKIRLKEFEEITELQAEKNISP
jgi:hypothetical protein